MKSIVRQAMEEGAWGMSTGRTALSEGMSLAGNPEPLRKKS